MAKYLQRDPSCLPLAKLEVADGELFVGCLERIEKSDFDNDFEISGPGIPGCGHAEQEPQGSDCPSGAFPNMA